LIIPRLKKPFEYIISLNKEKRMEENKPDLEEETTSIVRIEEMSLEESQLSAQLYNSAGLDPVVEAGLKDYDKHLHKEDKLISKVFGPRGTDIKGYGEAVAKRVAFAIYTLLNKQYGGKVGDLRSYIMTLQEERDRANARYDELMGRVVGILGEEYKDIRTDSKEFMERLTTVLGEDLKESRIDKKELAEKLADIDGLRLRIRALEEEKVELTEKHESQISALKKEHSEEVARLGAQIAELDSRIEGLESEKAALASDLEQLREDHEQLKKAMTTLASTIPDEGLGKKLRDELYGFILEDSRVPDRVIGGVGKFIDFKKYLGVAAERGAGEMCKRIEGILGTAR
jgi:outer membrane murein-binding lipoprotein Lpp